MADLQARIEELWNRASELAAGDPDASAAVDEAVGRLDRGEARVAEVGPDGATIVHEWLKKAILLLFRLRSMATIEVGPFEFADKLPLKHDFAASGVRVVPGGSARWGSYLAPGVILMPSYVNIGARVGEGTMVDTWATVGSCAQIGKNVHLSGGVGIGGVLEPLQANPVIIEDNCFIGARSEVVEGVIVEENSVISMGVYLGQSTKIYDRETGEVSYGRIPAGSVVVAGNLPSKDGSHSLYCAVIVKKVDAKTRAKVGLNELLRG
ncbi:MAG TPA: 2,3,4,5-tetrahydropyridine-2,6-dicarboxylate N-succinyltransferase, partial [Acidimicrobiales bacterium]|nr:2,3,4,5-tetrahydropyridine-2,6-dicarboxylate N-succinyltransferase [Acidimicrobiales bacterium]